MKPPRFTVEQWEAVNWDLPAKVIASHMGCRPALVYIWARRLGKTLPVMTRGTKPSVARENIDWRENNSVIARKTGYTPQWVSKLRHRAKKAANAKP